MQNRYVREFLWLSEDNAIPCKLPGPGQSLAKGYRLHAHIVIRSPGAKQKFVGCGQNALYLSFHDLDPVAIAKMEHFKEDPAGGHELIAACMNDTHAKDIVDFIKRCTLDTVFIVNCEAGISRSPAVVLACRRYFGGDTEEVFKKAIPNIHVATLLGKALEAWKG